MSNIEKAARHGVRFEIVFDANWKVFYRWTWGNEECAMGSETLERAATDACLEIGL